jgi:hypothetical protein
VGVACRGRERAVLDHQQEMPKLVEHQRCLS